MAIDRLYVVKFHWLEPALHMYCKFRLKTSCLNSFVQLAGGFNAQNNWLGQIQRGDFDSLRTHLVQRQNAAVIYNTAQSDLFVGAHLDESAKSTLL